MVGCKVTSEMRERARKVLAGTPTDTLSRFFRATLDDLIRKAESGEEIAEPISLLTVAQRRKLDRLE